MWPRFRKKFCTRKRSISLFTLNRQGEKGYKIDCLACRALGLNLLFNPGVQILIPEKLKYLTVKKYHVWLEILYLFCPFFLSGYMFI